MGILIISGIILIIVSVVLILKRGGYNKINYKDRIKLENILENEESNEKDVKSTSPNPTKDSSDVPLPTAKTQDDSIIKLTDESIKYYKKGVALFKEKKYEESISYLNTAIRLNSSEGIIYYYRGIAKSKLNLYRAAIDDFSHAIILNPKHGSAYFKRGMAKQITGDISGCCKDLKTAFEKGNPEANHYMKKFCN